MAAFDRPPRRASLAELLAYFAKLGAVGFGGPIALAEYMERDLVETRGWVSKQDYLQGLALAQLAPGPLAAQLAIYLGYAHGGALGATLVALAFILPSFLMVVALAAVYARYGGLAWVHAAFYGIGAAVMAIIARSGYKLAKKTIAAKRLLWAMFGAMALVTAVTGREIVGLFLLCGVVSLLVYAPRDWLARRRGLAAAAPLGLFAPYGAPAATWGTLATVLGFFTKASLFVFGSGLAIVPFLYGGVVRDYHWLTERQFLDAVAVAMITPGPVVITAGFIGYLVAGLAGSCLAALGVFLPVYLFVVLLAPWYRRHGRDPRLAAFVEGVTAAAVGALVGAVVILARGALVDATTIAIAAVSLVALVRFKVPEPWLVTAAGLLGVALAPAVPARAADASLMPVPVTMPGGQGGIGFDDLGFAPSLGKVLAPGGRTGRLFLVDPASRAVDGLAGFSADASWRGGHGQSVTSADSGAGLLFATDRDARVVLALEPRAGRVVASARLAAAPDYVRFAAARGEAWVSEPSAERIEIFSLGGAPTKRSLTRTADVSVPGGPESLVVDGRRGRAYAHTWKGETLAIDLASRKIVARWPNGCEGSRGIALDEERGWLFVGCDEGRAAALDVRDGKRLGAAAAGRGVDVIAYSPKLRHLYVPGSESATLTVLRVDDGGALSPLAVAKAAPGAHCAAADDRGGAWVCDPEGGRLLYYKDDLAAGR